MAELPRYRREELFAEAVKAWVEGQEGRWRPHASDEFLTAYLSRQLFPIIEDKSDPVDRSNLIYTVGCLLFETCFEHGCGVITNGHHVAQNLAAAFQDFNPSESED